MKPANVALLCLACSFGSAGVTYLLNQMFEDPATPRRAPVDRQPEPAKLVIEGADPRVTELENQLALLRNELADVQVAAAERPTYETGPWLEDVDAEPETTVFTQEIIRGLEERIAGIEADASASRAFREQAIIRLKEGNSRDRLSAARLLGSLAKGGDAMAKQALIDALASDNADIRKQALGGIASSGLTEFLPALEGMLDDENAGVRNQVAGTLRSMPIEEAAPVLIKLLKDEDANVLRNAADALGDKGYTGAARDLLPLTRHPEERVALEASIALKRCGDDSAAQVWVPTLGSRLTSTDTKARRNAVNQLYRMGLESTRPYLEQALKDKDSRVRRDAKRGLANLDKKK